MKDLLHKFENKRPEIVFEWKDAETEAEGWVVINSLRGGAAGGGTRMRVGLDKREVESLAKTMEVKFTVAGPPIGGAKSGINFDPKDPRKEGVLRRWYAAVTPLLKLFQSLKIAGSGIRRKVFLTDISSLVKLKKSIESAN
jgi:glutamate dehydrogenase/leucine dehydrogenase